MAQTESHFGESSHERLVNTRKRKRPKNDCAYDLKRDFFLFRVKWMSAQSHGICRGRGEPFRNALFSFFKSRLPKFLKELTGLLGFGGVSETDISPNKNCADEVPDAHLKQDQKRRAAGGWRATQDPLTILRGKRTRGMNTKSTQRILIQLFCPTRTTPRTTAYCAGQERWGRQPSLRGQCGHHRRCGRGNES